MAELDPLIHAPARLQVLTTLAAVSEAEFATLRDALEVSDSVLSKHISTLADAGYVRSRKARPGGATHDVDRADQRRPEGPPRARRGTAPADPTWSTDPGRLMATQAPVTEVELRPWPDGHVLSRPSRPHSPCFVGPDGDLHAVPGTDLVMRLAMWNFTVLRLM